MSKQSGGSRSRSRSRPGGPNPGGPNPGGPNPPRSPRSPRSRPGSGSHTEHGSMSKVVTSQEYPGKRQGSKTKGTKLQGLHLADNIMKSKILDTMARHTILNTFT